MRGLPFFKSKNKPQFAGLNFSDTSSGGGGDTSTLANKTDISSLSLSGTTNTSGGTISAGTWFYLNGELVRAKVDIANNATFTLDTNYEKKTVGEELKSLNSNVGGAWKIADYGSLGSSSPFYFTNVTLDINNRVKQIEYTDSRLIDFKEAYAVVTGGLDTAGEYQTLAIPRPYPRVNGYIWGFWNGELQASFLIMIDAGSGKVTLTISYQKSSGSITINNSEWCNLYMIYYR